MSGKAGKKLLLFIVSALTLVLFIFPLLMIFVNSLKPRLDIVRDPLSLPGSLSFGNYKEAFETMNFSHALLNSVIVTVLSVGLILIFSSMLAYFLVRWKWKINNYILMILVSSMIIPFQAVMIPFVSIYGDLNMLNSKWWLAYFYLGFGLAMATFMYHGFVKGVPKELEEAALIDGAGKLRVFAQVVFPILKPISTTLAILDVLWIWNDFLLPSLVLISEDDRTLPLSTFYFFGKYTSDYGVAMAALVLSMIPVIIFYLFMQKQIIRGVVEGAVK
ncbi:carbohydrate ABC transporter permease [Paenibacillus phocaensis]|uniref:carbohydrate ABC transporter permease n=1 Tax=Paenibacillus phocaensis TaxID=1776378 RepID=UPI0003A2AE25|nr:carbohydrate ABC transporter permease [Paenibacillus phocaensis]